MNKKFLLVIAALVGFSGYQIAAEGCGSCANKRHVSQTHEEAKAERKELKKEHKENRDARREKRKQDKKKHKTHTSSKKTTKTVSE